MPLFPPPASSLVKYEADKRDVLNKVRKHGNVSKHAGFEYTTNRNPTNTEYIQFSFPLSQQDKAGITTLIIQNAHTLSEINVFNLTSEPYLTTKDMSPSFITRLITGGQGDLVMNYQSSATDENNTHATPRGSTNGILPMHPHTWAGGPRAATMSHGCAGTTLVELEPTNLFGGGVASHEVRCAAAQQSLLPSVSDLTVVTVSSKKDPAREGAGVRTTRGDAYMSSASSRRVSNDEPWAAQEFHDASCDVPSRSDGETTTNSSLVEDSPDSEASTLSGSSCSVTLKSNFVPRPAFEMMMTNERKAATAFIRQPEVSWTAQVDCLYKLKLNSDYVTIVDDAVRYGDRPHEAVFAAQGKVLRQDTGGLTTQYHQALDGDRFNSVNMSKNDAVTDARGKLGEEMWRAFASELEEGKRICPQCPELEVHMNKVDPKSLSRVTAILYSYVEFHGKKPLPQQKQLHCYTLGKEMQRSMTFPTGSIQNRVTVAKAVKNFQKLEALKEQHPHKLPFRGGSEKQFWGSRDKDNNTILVLM